MSDLPENMLAEIEEKVARFRKLVTAAAEKRWTLGQERKQKQVNRPSKEDVRERGALALELWIAGHTLKTIAEKTGYSKYYVRDVIFRAERRKAYEAFGHDNIHVGTPEWDKYWDLRRDMNREIEEQRRLNQRHLK